MEEQAQYTAGKPVSKLLEIKITKGTFLLYEHELITLLTTRPELWRQALKRGKYHIRKKKEEGRAERREKHVV